MDFCRSPKHILLGEMSIGVRPIGRPKARFKDVCKTTLQEFEIDPEDLERKAEDRSGWRASVKEGFLKYEYTRKRVAEIKRAKRKTAVKSCLSVVCSICGRVCAANIGRISHEKKCIKALGLL